MINSEVVDNSSLDEGNSILVGVAVDIFEAVVVSVGPGGLIDTSDVIDGTWELVVDEEDTTDSVDEEAVEVSVGSGGIDSSVDIIGRVEVFVVETSVD